jgi:hypothetical protein
MAHPSVEIFDDTFAILNLAGGLKPEDCTHHSLMQLATFQSFEILQRLQDSSTL